MPQKTAVGGVTVMSYGHYVVVRKNVGRVTFEVGLDDIINALQELRCTGVQVTDALFEHGLAEADRRSNEGVLFPPTHPISQISWRPAMPPGQRCDGCGVYITRPYRVFGANGPGFCMNCAAVYTTQLAFNADDNRLTAGQPANKEDGHV